MFKKLAVAILLITGNVYAQVGVSGAPPQPVVNSMPLTYAATLSTPAYAANNFRVTLTGNVTLASPTGATDQQRVTWEFIQDGTGSRTVTLPASFKFGTDVTSFVATTTPSLADYLIAIYNSSTTNWNVVAVSHGYIP